MRVGLLVPGSIREIGSVQIYAKNVRAAFATCGEAEVSLYDTEEGLRRLRQDLTARKLDVIQVENRPLRLLQIREWIRQSGANTALVLNLHSLNFVEQQKGGLQTMWQALVLADAIIVNSQAVKKRFDTIFSHEAARAYVVYPGVDPTAFSSRQVPAGANLIAEDILDKRNPVVLFAGRLVERKGLNVAIEAIRLLRQTHPDAVLLVAGGQGRNSSDVLYLGKLSHEDMPRAYSLADVLICPSQRFEAFGLVNVEAMAHGLPVVASRLGGIPEVVQHGVTGYLVDDYRNPAAFVKSLRLALVPSQKESLGDAGRRIILEQFQWEHTKNSLYDIYKSLLEEKAR